MKPRHVLEEGLPVICGDCRMEMMWLGNRKTCGCSSPVPAAPVGRRKCSKGNTAKKGRTEEQAICRQAEEWGYQAYRTAGSGAHGSRNNEQSMATDVRMKKGDFVVRIESKRHASVGGLKTLLKLKDNSEILWVREDFGEPYVLMSAEVFGRFASLAAEVLK